MDIITVILASLLAIASPVGAVVDQLAEDAIRQQIVGADELYVRIDNVPNYQLLNGRVEHIRLAGRGVYPIPDLRIATIDLETDAVDVDFGKLQQGDLQLDEPLQAALHLVLQADDLNTFLNSDLVKEFLDGLRFSLPGQNSARERNRYGLANPTLTFIEGDRLRIVLDLEDRVENEQIPITLELGLAIANGHQIQLIDPQITIEGVEAPPELIQSFVAGANQQLSLKQFEASGITARILDFEIRNNELDIALFAKVDPSSTLFAEHSSTAQPNP